MRTLFPLLLTLDVILNSIEISLGMLPTTKNSVATAGTTGKQANHQVWSTLVPRGWKPEAHPPRSPKWKFLTIDGYAVKVLRNPVTGYLEDIQLANNHKPRPRFNPKAHMQWVCDVPKGLEFIAHLDDQENWISLSPMNAEYREKFKITPTSPNARWNEWVNTPPHVVEESRKKKEARERERSEFTYESWLKKRKCESEDSE